MEIFNERNKTKESHNDVLNFILCNKTETVHFYGLWSYVLGNTVAELCS